MFYHFFRNGVHEHRLCKRDIVPQSFLDAFNEELEASDIHLHESIFPAFEQAIEPLGDLHTNEQLVIGGAQESLHSLLNQFSDVETKKNIDVMNSLASLDPLLGDIGVEVHSDTYNRQFLDIDTSDLDDVTVYEYDDNGNLVRQNNVSTTLSSLGPTNNVLLSPSTNVVEVQTSNESGEGGVRSVQTTPAAPVAPVQPAAQPFFNAQDMQDILAATTTFIGDLPDMMEDIRKAREGKGSEGAKPERGPEGPEGTNGSGDRAPENDNENGSGESENEETPKTPEEKKEQLATIVNTLSLSKLDGVTVRAIGESTVELTYKDQKKEVEINKSKRDDIEEEILNAAKEFKEQVDKDIERVTAREVKENLKTLDSSGFRTRGEVVLQNPAGKYGEDYFIVIRNPKTDRSVLLGGGEKLDAKSTTDNNVTLRIPEEYRTQFEKEVEFILMRPRSLDITGLLPERIDSKTEFIGSKDRDPSNPKDPRAPTDPRNIELSEDFDLDASEFKFGTITLTTSSSKKYGIDGGEVVVTIDGNPIPLLEESGGTYVLFIPKELRAKNAVTFVLEERRFGFDTTVFGTRIPLTWKEVGSETANIPAATPQEIQKRTEELKRIVDDIRGTGALDVVEVQVTGPRAVELHYDGKNVPLEPLFGDSNKMKADILQAAGNLKLLVLKEKEKERRESEDRRKKEARRSKIEKAKESLPDYGTESLLKKLNEEKIAGTLDIGKEPQKYLEQYIEVLTKVLSSNPNSVVTAEQAHDSSVTSVDTVVTILTDEINDALQKTGVNAKSDPIIANMNELLKQNITDKFFIRRDGPDRTLGTKDDEPALTIFNADEQIGIAENYMDKVHLTVFKDVYPQLLKEGIQDPPHEFKVNPIGYKIDGKNYFGGATFSLISDGRIKIEHGGDTLHFDPLHPTKEFLSEAEQERHKLVNNVFRSTLSNLFPGARDVRTPEKLIAFLESRDPSKAPTRSGDLYMKNGHLYAVNVSGQFAFAGRGIGNFALKAIPWLLHHVDDAITDIDTAIIPNFKAILEEGNVMRIMEAIMSTPKHDYFENEGWGRKSGEWNQMKGFVDMFSMVAMRDMDHDQYLKTIVELHGGNTKAAVPTIPANAIYNYTMGLEKDNRNFFVQAKLAIRDVNGDGKTNNKDVLLEAHDGTGGGEKWEFNPYNTDGNGHWIPISS